MSGFVVRIAIVLISFSSLTTAKGAEPPVADRTAWEQVDIVPMPKRIRLTGQRLTLSNAVIVLGEQPSEQEEIGAKWINDKIVEKGRETLPVATEGKLSGDARLRIFIGTRETCDVIDQAARDGRFELGPGVPGKRGYVIHPRRTDSGMDLLLGGADAIGALYACVTLAGLLEEEGGEVLVREAQIVDWPDYAAVTDGINLIYPELGELGRRLRWAVTPSEEQEEQYLRVMKEHLDRLLERKYSCFRVDKTAIGPRYWRKLSPEFMATYKQVTEYAKTRGIRSLIYALPPCVGQRSELPDVPQRCLTGIGRDSYEQYVRCWSMDEERRKNAARLGRFLQATGITDTGFHDWDTGAFLSPANWGERCDVCRQRWGDDFAAATINKHRIYHEEIKKAAPDCRLHFTLYPYNVSVLSQATAEQYHIDRYGPSPSVPDVARRLRERFTNFWVRCTGGLPDDVTFCIRENIPVNVRRFHEISAPHGTFAWYKVGSEQWRTFFDESPRWAGTFYSGRDDLLFNVSLETFVPLKAMAVREYTWNLHAPGATGWAQLPQEERQRHAEAKGEIYDIVLPHIVRNFFGRRAAPELVRAFSLNMAVNHIFDHLPSRKRQIPVLTTYEQWNWQADQAAAGCEIMDGLFQEFVDSGDRLGMTPYAARRFVYMREVFHCSKWMAQAKTQNILARELAKEGKLDEARKAIEQGLSIVADAHEDMKRLVAERPEDPIYNAKDDPDRPALWKIYTPGNRVDYGVPEAMLAATEKELPALAAAGDLPADAVERLSERRTIHVVPASKPPKIDGAVDELDWQRAEPAEAFFAYPGGQGIARAHTRARFLRDDDTLYFGVTSWMPGDARVRVEDREHDGNVMDDEQVELFLMPPSMKGGYLQFQMNAAGCVADKRVTLERKQEDVTVKKTDRRWDAKGIIVKTNRGPGAWELEAAIPLTSLGAADWRGTWRVNVCRDFKGATRELSSIQPPSAEDFHDTRMFPRLVFDSTLSPPPDIEIAVAGLEHATRTLDDRVATVVDFGLDVRASRVLHDVRVVAETYDESGRLHQRKAVKELDHLPFYWKPDERFSVGFERQVTKAGVRVLLGSREGGAGRWIRLGGWEGTPELSPVFSLPSDDSADDELSATQGLAGQCYFAGEITSAATKKPHRILGRRQGTVEFWFKSDWPSKHPLDVRATRMPRHVLFHCGVLREEHPENFNCSSVTAFFDSGGEALYFMISNRQYVAWQAGARAENAPWTQPGWHHLACVWDHDAKPDDWLRLYIDGVRVSAKTTVNKPDRLGDDKAVELDKTAFAFQCGSLNTGRCEGNAVLDELRISRIARYTANFIPAHKPLPLDERTTALFHFDGDLHGEGVSEEGEHYTIDAVAGVLEFH